MFNVRLPLNSAIDQRKGDPHSDFLLRISTSPSFFDRWNSIVSIALFRIVWSYIERIFRKISTQNNNTLYCSNLESPYALVIYSLIFLFETVSLHLIRAKKRAAWRQNRLRTLEQDAAAAQQTIQSMNKVPEDSTKKNEVSSSQYCIVPNQPTHLALSK